MILKKILNVWTVAVIEGILIVFLLTAIYGFMTNEARLTQERDFYKSESELVASESARLQASQECLGTVESYTIGDDPRHMVYVDEVKKCLNL